MTFSTLPARKSWILFLVMTCGLVAWTAARRAERVTYVSTLALRDPLETAVDAGSVTGYRGGVRYQLVPERVEESYHAIAQTQSGLRDGILRQRTVDYDNAPQGRAVYSTAPYRLWLAGVAKVIEGAQGLPPGIAVEKAALWGEPVLLLVALVGLTIFAARVFGGFAATLLCTGLATLFPLAARFLPGVPQSHGLMGLSLFAALLTLGAGQKEGRRVWFVVAGVFGGFATWVEAPAGVLFLAVLVVGCALSIWVTRKATELQLPQASWRWMGVSGATVVLGACAWEYFPKHLGDWQWEGLHPAYGLAWLGGGELLEWWAGSVSGQKGGVSTWRGVASLLLGCVFPLVLGLSFWFSEGPGLFVRDLATGALTHLPNGVIAAGLGAWSGRDGSGLGLVATLAPFVLGAGFVVFIWIRGSVALRARLLVAGVPVAAAVAFAWQRLSWWSVADLGLLALLVVVAEAAFDQQRRLQFWISGVFASVGVLGAYHAWPAAEGGASMVLSPKEAEQVVERHLAHWLSRMAGDQGVVVYAPPLVSSELSYFGGHRSIGTFAPENKVGFGVSLMIAGANTAEEARALLESRGTRYIVVPSWDPFFDEFAERYLDRRFAKRTSLLFGQLRRFEVPVWLKPLAYRMPLIQGFEDKGVLVFEVVDDQAPVVADARLTEYLIETGRIAQALKVAETLRRFAGDVVALTARAEAFEAAGDKAGLGQVIQSLTTRLRSGGARFLAWDRRVSLAVVLAKAGELKAARDEMERCVAELDEKRLRSLSGAGLYFFEVLRREFKLPVKDERLLKLEQELMPLDLQNQL